MGCGTSVPTKELPAPHYNKKPPEDDGSKNNTDSTENNNTNGIANGHAPRTGADVPKAIRDKEGTGARLSHSNPGSRRSSSHSAGFKPPKIYHTPPQKTRQKDPALQQLMHQRVFLNEARTNRRTSTSSVKNVNK